MKANNRKRIIAGIDLAAGRGTTEVALLALAEGHSRSRYRAHVHERTITDEDIVVALVEALRAVIAIDAPLSLPAPVAAAVRGEPTVGAFCTRPLASASRSPYIRQAERDPLWSELGLRPLPVSFLGGLTFRALVLAPELRTALPDAAIIEVFPTATLRLLGARHGEPGTKRAAKTSEIARRAAQQVLSRVVAGIPPVDDELLGADLLDALAAALTGVAYFRGEFVTAGDPGEGMIVLPSAAFVHHVRSCASCQVFGTDDR